MSDVFSQSGTARSEIYSDLASLRLIDPHTHINPHSPASTTLADLLGYHYYTELAHSAGMPKSRIEEKGIGPKELVERLVGGLAPLENTVQYSWLIAICKTFFGFDEDRLHLNNWESLYDHSETVMSSAQWPDIVLDQSNVQAVFLTNDFDDDLVGFDTDRYIPCLRTDDLVFHLADPVVRERLAKCTGIELDGSLSSLRASLRVLFEHFVGRGARACAISLPPTFTPTSVPDGRAATALDAVLRSGLMADESHREALSRRVFWTLAELCDEFQLPFDLMIGVNRKVYPAGVYQGQDLYDSRVSLIQYRELFNAFTDVKFPVSVLASVTNQELVSYAWIFPNVIPNGHWWYSNTPSKIAHDLAHRLEAVPQTKLIGYYSDAYKLEFVWPKFDMYRKVLSGVLADNFVRDQGWSIERAVELGRTVLKDNTEEVFPRPARSTTPESDSSTFGDVAGLAGAGIAAAGLAVGSSEIDEVEEIDDLGSLSGIEAASDQDGELAGENEVDENDDDLTGAAGVTDLAAVASAETLRDEAPGEESPMQLLEGLDAIEEPTTDELADIELVDPAPVLPEAKVIDEPQLEGKSADEDRFAVDDMGETFDTVVLDPNFASTPRPETLDSESQDHFASADEVKSDVDGHDDFDADSDLGSAFGKSDDLKPESFSEDSAATVVEVRDSGTIGLDESLGEDPVTEADASNEMGTATEPGGSDESDDSAAESKTTDEPEAESTESSEAVADAGSRPDGDQSDRVTDADEVSHDSDDDFLIMEDDSQEGAIEASADSELDPLPMDDELNELDLDDVELLDPSAEPVHDAGTIATVLDDVPLDVGDLTSDEDEGESGAPQIQQLRGESSFAPDDDSLQLLSDPLTGELRYSPAGERERPENRDPGTDDDNDEFNLSWLDDDDDADKIES
ncbi:glucuronate isomerase [Aporhodopirellula aestuarii]|uniref:Amidohydrolase n=1 Tax=Aporhodopirellula aestuarii TaxID=2950107 RepID=A0ABT0U0T3_9BACT|nr:amidohydrolase [Aporhodopirellula aestuarii]MCM2370460.1 amidohydrolase [Aporhodopirellula aestuarii]